MWADDNMQNIRFSGGEPTVHPGIVEIIKNAKAKGIKRIAISTNGSADFSLYKELLEAGVNDFSISLDACCAAFGDKMAGASGHFNTVTDNIRKLSALTYDTVGIVVTDENVGELKKVVQFAHDLGVSDIRVISAAQWNQMLSAVEEIDKEILEAHPILKYRVKNILSGRNVRGISDEDCSKCHLVKDDSAIAGDFHFPCIIYMREQGDPIGRISTDMRKERIEWFKKHNTHSDPICSKNCLDVCIDFNNKCRGNCISVVGG
jgi:molybdenum cofactor biosynthesis enzyme MoaA